MNATMSPGSASGDWTTMTISDWMEATPTDWIDRALPGWRDWSYGNLLRASPTQWWTGMVTPWSAQTAWPAARPAHRPRHHHDRHHHRHGCGCGHEHGHEHHHRHQGCARCGPEPCECFCCLGDVDLAVYARVGERRVVPITVENERRREKTVTLELSEWTTRGGSPGQVRTDLLEPKAFTVAPCGEQSVVLVVDVGTPDKTPGKRGDNAAEEGRKLPDVDGCEVVTADLRLVGCDHRPIRIAVAILPRDCDPYTVGCGCTCC